MHIELAGKPETFNPVTANILPLSGETVLFKGVPVYGFSDALQVATISTSRFGPPHARPVTSSVEMLITSTIDPDL